MNIVINSSKWTTRDLEVIFGDMNNCITEEIKCVDTTSLPHLLRDLGIFKSVSEAVRAGRTGEIPSGYSQIRASKKVMLYVWNPSE